MKWIFIFVLFSLVLNETVFAENRDSTLAVMKRNIHFITNAAEQFHINPIYLSAIIYTERHQNYSWQDRVFDIDLYKKLGKNSSIGFCQIKIKTAYFIEYCYNTDNYLYFPGKQYENMLVQSDNPDELIIRLVDDSTNICYAAAYLRIIAGRWNLPDFLLMTDRIFWVLYIQPDCFIKTDRRGNHMPYRVQMILVKMWIL